jgi:hypothetical protein
MKVSFNAVFRRLKRALLRQGMMLHKSRENSRCWHDLGAYYSSGFNNHLNGTDIDVVEMARELKLLRQHEVVAE